MTVNGIGKGVVWILSGYFVLSGVMAAVDLDTKLARIGLTAVNEDGKIAFLLIYTSLMVGIGVAMGLLFWMTKTWQASLLLGATIITSFIVFRIVGSLMVGALSETQLGFLITEVIELLILVIIFQKAGGCSNIFCQKNN